MGSWNTGQMLSDAMGRVYEMMSKDFISESSPVNGQRQGALEHPKSGRTPVPAAVSMGRLVQEENIQV